MRFTSLSNDPELGDRQMAQAVAAQRGPADPARQVMDGEVHRRVLEAMDALDDEYRVAIVLRNIEDMDYEQIAAVLAVPVGTVKSRLHRARCMLREKLSGIMDVKTE